MTLKFTGTKPPANGIFDDGMFRDAMCTGKQSFDSFDAALLVCRRRKREGTARRRGTLRPYRCGYCHKWHLGNPKQ